MESVNEQVIRLFKDGVLLEDIHKSMNLPVKSIVDIIFNAKIKNSSSSITGRRTSCYIYFCEFMFENVSIRDIVRTRSVNEEECIIMIGNVLKMESIPSSLRMATIEKISKEFGENPKEIAKRIGVNYNKSFAKTIKRLWR